jgi:hypothetical protein
MPKYSNPRAVDILVIRYHKAEVFTIWRIVTARTAEVVQSNTGSAGGSILNKGNPGSENRAFTGSAIGAASRGSLTLKSTCGTKKRIQPRYWSASRPYRGRNG